MLGFEKQKTAFITSNWITPKRVRQLIAVCTEGIATINGRVASLLEIGTGFHQELSGRENIFLNGTILGMKKKEIIDKFEEIVEFSEIGKFININSYYNNRH